MIPKGLPWRRWKELMRFPSPHRQADDELRKREARYRTVLDAARDAIVTITPDGTIRWFNRGAEGIFGHRAEEVIGRPVTLLMPERYRELCVAGLHRYLETGEARVVGGTTELVGLRKDGNEFPIELSLGETREGKARLFTAVIRDITDRKESEKRLREAETRYQTLVEQIPAVTYVQEPLESDKSKAITYMSPQYETMLGYPPETEMVDKEHWLRTLHPEDRERVLAEEVRTDRTGEPFKIEYRVIAGDGRVVWVRDHAVLVRDEDGEPLYWLGVQYDITEQKRTEEALREARDLFRSVFDHAPIGVAMVSLEGRYLQVNRSLCEILGYSEDELLATTWQEITYPDDLEASLALARRIERGEIPRYHLEKRYLRADGHTVWASLSVSLVRNSEGEPLYFVAQIQDVTARKDAEEALRRSEGSLAAAQRLAQLGSWALDLETGEMYWSDELYRILGFEPREVVPSYEHFFDSVHPEDKERVENVVREGLPEGGRYDFEFRINNPDGLERVVHAQVEVVSDEAGRPTSVLGAAHDITESKNFEAALELLLRQHEMVLQSAGEGIFGLDMRGNVTFVNPAAARMTGWNIQELLGRPMHDLLHHTKPDGTPYPSEECPIYAALEDRVIHSSGDEVFWRKDGTSFPVEYTSTPIVEDDIVGAVVTFKDITDRKALEEQLHYQAFHDSLTGLPVRAVFMGRLEHALARTDRQGSKVAVLFMDLDDLKVINDSLGHKAGDELLVTVAKRLKDCLRPEDTAARVGGDEFTILVENVNSVTDVARIAERIAKALQPPFVLDKQEVFATTSIGIALSSSALEQPEDLLRYADLAMYRAKHKGKARFELFEPGMHTNVLERLKLETELRRAILRQQFKVYYQPVTALRSGRIAAAEALVRWDHPERGLLLPEVFLGVAEETGLIMQIGQWVLREACNQARIWQEQYPGSPPVTISVNLSTREFFHPELVAEVLGNAQIDPSTLQLEITEGAMTGNGAHSASGTLWDLKNLGVQLAIDDFGMGYSSLTYLKRFPVDFLKIDRSFVGGLGHDPNKDASKDVEIVSAMIKLAHALDLKVIAEGVETAEQLAWLRSMNCDLAQGNYFSEPLPSGALSELLRDNFGNRG
jgi:diguanylate cyclase (GGDEF)-like protein/PAS domain S-box-containing protein